MSVLGKVGRTAVGFGVVGGAAMTAADLLNVPFWNALAFAAVFDVARWLADSTTGNPVEIWFPRRETKEPTGR